MTDPSRRNRSDSAARARVVNAMGWALFPGFFMGGIAGFVLAGRAGFSPGASLVAALMTIIVLTTAFALGSLAASHGVGSGIHRLLHPTAGRRDPEHSAGRALRAHGRTDEAVQYFLRVIREAPDDADAHVMLANIYWKDLREGEDALGVLRAALRQMDPRSAKVRLIVRQAFELGRSGAVPPGSVVPALARHRDLCDDIGESQWAERSLAELRSIADGPFEESESDEGD